jgi:hypothetical protein
MNYLPSDPDENTAEAYKREVGEVLDPFRAEAIVKEPQATVIALESEPGEKARSVFHISQRYVGRFRNANWKIKIGLIGSLAWSVYMIYKAKKYFLDRDRGEAG